MWRAPTVLAVALITFLAVAASGQRRVTVPPGIVLEKDVVYASVDGHDLLLDIAYHKPPTPARPAVVHIHFTVIIGQSELLYEALKKAGVETQFVRVKNAGHGLRPTPPGPKIDPTRDEITRVQNEWLRRHLTGVLPQARK